MQRQIHREMKDDMDIVHQEIRDSMNVMVRELNRLRSSIAQTAAKHQGAAAGLVTLAKAMQKPGDESEA